MKLTAKKRSSLPKSAFALPSERAYPVNDKSHAKVAKAYASRFASPSERARIDARANRVLGKPANSFNRARKVLQSSRGR